MKKNLSALLAALYLVQIFLVLTFKFMPESVTADYQIPPLAYFLFGFLLLSVVLAVINIIRGIKAYMASLYHVGMNDSFGTILAFKIGLVPFFLINFVLWAVVFVIGAFNPFMMFLWIFIPFGIGYTYLMLLATSAYTIPHIIRLKRGGHLTKRQCVFHVVLQLLFVTDVIDSIIFYSKYRKHNTYRF
ncbi:MAG: hypothetical protein LBL15_01415 [Oscillospiraceae bacterium]|jgi:hypothetical protein|nr:hypothetical protein [Oscillospiraceae bacterium]